MCEPEPTTLIFDLSEVLIAGLLGIEKPLSLALDISEQQVLSELNCSPLDQLFCGDLSEDDYLALLVKQTGWVVSVEFIKRILRENFQQVIHGMPPLLEKLSSKYELILLSDHAREWIAYIESVHSFLQYFKHRFYSFQLNQTKRQSSTFLMVLDRIHREPYQCLFIDDSETNVRAAREKGIPSLRFSGIADLKMAMAENDQLKDVL